MEKNVVSDHLLHSETRQFLAQGGDSWLSEWIIVQSFCQYLVQEWAYDTILVHEGLWGRPCLFRRHPRTRCSPFLSPIIWILTWRCDAWGIVPTTRGASPKGKVGVLTGVEREKRTHVPSHIMSCWGNLSWTCANTELLIMWKNTFPSPLFKLLLVAFSLTCNWSVQFSSVTQSYQTLCDPMNHSTPGLPVHHQLPEFTQTHAHRVSDAIQPSYPLSSLSPPAPQSLRASGSFPMSQHFTWGG